MDLLLTYFSTIESSRNFVASALLVIGVLVLRFLALQFLRNSKKLKSHVKRKWVRNTKNVFITILLVGIVIIWTKELRNVAFSLLALGVAGVLATKEIIVCTLGGIYLKISRPFDVGDRIEIDDYKGDVIDYSLLTTEIYEIGPNQKLNQYTGKKIQIPNSLLFDKAVLNHSLSKEYTLHTFSIIIPTSIDWERSYKIILELAKKETDEYLKIAEKSLHKASLKEDILDLPNIEPRISIFSKSKDELEFIIRVPTPNLKQGVIQQNITKKYLQALSVDSQSVQNP